ncbi:cytochrome b [Govanella unica]|uniref:Cytochrome b n=1 Tax=Govanella unica TaxID=2975056 RepID=A0A9X3TXK5_9PROT|nr:cytochrome b [Govania unica]MDA5193540.1 cytochrome b [Govania unica]
MERSPQGARYSSVAILLHWLIALVIIGQFWLGFHMTGQKPGSAEQFANFQLHKSIGITILMLTALRLAWRLGHRPPPLPDHMSRLERRLAVTSHHGLYLLMFVIPLSGWALVSASPLKLPILLYSRLPWPHIPGLQGFADQKAVADGLGETHEILAILMLLLLLVHVAAALRHHLLLKDDILIRMLPFVGKRGP